MFFNSSDDFINIGDFRMIIGELVEIIAMITFYFLGGLLIYLDREYPEDNTFFGVMLLVLASLILIFVIIRVFEMNKILLENWWNTEVW